LLLRGRCRPTGVGTVHVIARLECASFFLPIHYSRDCARGRSDEDITKVVLGSVGVSVDGLVEEDAITRKPVCLAAIARACQAGLSRTCIPCHRAGLASGWRRLPHWGLPHRRGTRPWGVGRSRAPCRDRCAAVHQHLHLEYHLQKVFTKLNIQSRGQLHCVLADW